MRLYMDVLFPYPTSLRLESVNMPYSSHTLEALCHICKFPTAVNDNVENSRTDLGTDLGF